MDITRDLLLHLRLYVNLGQYYMYIMVRETCGNSYIVQEGRVSCEEQVSDILTPSWRGHHLLKQTIIQYLNALPVEGWMAAVW